MGQVGRRTITKVNCGALASFLLNTILPNLSSEQAEFVQ